MILQALYDGAMLIGLFIFGAIMLVGILMTFNAFFVIPILWIAYFQGDVTLWIAVVATPVSVVISGLGWRFLDPVGPQRS